MKQLKNLFIIFLIGGACYYLIETVYKGIMHGCGSHWSMFVLGGLLTVIVGLFNEFKFSWECPVWKQMILGGIAITTGEFITGLIVNTWLGWNVWDYTGIPGNIMGQVCPQFTLIWCALSLLIILADDFIRYKFFGEEKPRYKWI